MVAGAWSLEHGRWRSMEPLEEWGNLQFSKN